MTIGSICSRATYLADPSETARAAAERMRKENVGTLLVLDERRHPIGILTDRDMALRIVAEGVDPEATTVAEVMTGNVRTIAEQAPIEDALALMRTLGVRRLAVVDDDGRLAGVVTVDDVLELVTEELANVGRIVGLGQPGVNLPMPRTREARTGAPAAAGLERASADIEC